MNLAFAVLGCFLGTIIGALPGIGPVNGVAILIPLAFALKLDPTTVLILLSCIYYGCTYGGRIASIMLNIPGDASSIMATLDGHPMAKAGKASEALAISAVASFIGSSIATLGLTLFAPLLAKAAIYFGPADYFALYVLAFAMIGGYTTIASIQAGIDVWFAMLVLSQPVVGIIGPTRMRYSRAIDVVENAATAVGNVLRDN